MTKHSMNYDVIVLTETRCCNNNRVYFPGFKTVHGENLLGSGGVSISVRSHIDFEYVRGCGAPPAGYNTVGIRTRNLERNLNILAIYRHPRGSVIAKDLYNLFGRMDGGGDSIILGDFNAHNTTWNCVSTNPGGEILMDVMEGLGFFCINIDTKSRIGH